MKIKDSYIEIQYLSRLVILHSSLESGWRFVENALQSKMPFGYLMSHQWSSPHLEQGRHRDWHSRLQNQSNDSRCSCETTWTWNCGNGHSNGNQRPLWSTSWWKYEESYFLFQRLRPNGNLREYENYLFINTILTIIENSISSAISY